MSFLSTLVKYEPVEKAAAENSAPNYALKVIFFFRFYCDVAFDISLRHFWLT